MRDLVVLFLHLLATVARLAGPGGARSWWPNPCCQAIADLAVELAAPITTDDFPR